MNLIHGVKNIELIPSLDDSLDITPSLARLFEGSYKVRAAIAFWTLSFQRLAAIVGTTGANSFQNPDSFLCVDIQAPTNIDSLASLNQNNVSVNLNLRRLHPSLKKETSSSGLLHTKVIVADKNDGDAEIWVGSHNWTQFALKGPNTEATLSVTCDRISPIYYQMTTFLQNIKDQLCDPFDISMLDIYKQIQGDLAGKDEGEIAVVVELESDNAHHVGIENILFFGTEMTDYRSLTKVGGKVQVLLTDSQKKSQFLHNARVVKTGEMTSFNSSATNIQFPDAIRYAFSIRRGFPKLLPSQVVPGHVLHQAKFYVELELHNRDDRGFSISEYAPRQKMNWTDNDYDPAYEMMSKSDMKLSSDQVFDVYPRIQVPFFKRDETKPSEAIFRRFLELPIEEKREVLEYKMVRKAIIKYDTD